MSLSRPLRLAATVALVVLVVPLLNFKLLLVKRSADRRVGVYIEERAVGLEITEVFPGEPAERAGLHAGDRILALDGRRVGSNADYDQVATGFERGRPVVFEVLRDGRKVSVEVRPGVAGDWLPAIGDVFVALCYLALAVLALYHGAGDLRATLLFLFSGAVAVELALPQLGGVIGDVPAQVLAGAGFYLVTGFQFATSLHLVSVIPRRAGWLEGRGWLVPAFYAVGLGTGAMLCLSVIGDWLDVQTLPWTGDQAGWFVNVVGLAVWAALVVAILSHQARSSEDVMGRRQATVVLAGEAPWATLMIVTSAATVLGGSVPSFLFELQQLILLCFPVAVLVAIFRYRLLDLEPMVRRSMIYTSLTGALVLVFYAAVGAGGALLSQWVEGGASVIVIAAATLLLGLLFSPLRGWLQRLIDRRFFPHRHAQRQRLASIAAAMPTLGTVPAMGTYLVDQLSQAFHATSGTLLLADPASRVLLTVASTTRNPDRDFNQSFLLSPDDPGVEVLRRARRPLPTPQLAPRSASLAQRLHLFGADLAVPIMLQDDLIALLLLGGKVSGEPYRGEEIELLTLVSHHVATVFENARLFESATVDPLTALLRREVAIDHLRRELQRAVRHDRPLAVGMADLDRFKTVNDRHGHLVGDALLKLAAQAMRSVLRSVDVIGRYGGEEFLIVLPETDLAGALTVAEKVRAAVDRISLPLDTGGSVEITISIGLAVEEHAASGDEDAVQQLLARADRNLLRAKEAGRNRIEPAAVEVA